MPDSILQMYVWTVHWSDAANYIKFPPLDVNLSSGASAMTRLLQIYLHFHIFIPFQLNQWRPSCLFTFYMKFNTRYVTLLEQDTFSLPRWNVQYSTNLRADYFCVNFILLFSFTYKSHLRMQDSVKLKRLNFPILLNSFHKNTNNIITLNPIVPNSVPVYSHLCGLYKSLYAFRFLSKKTK